MCIKQAATILCVLLVMCTSVSGTSFIFFLCGKSIHVHCELFEIFIQVSDSTERAKHRLLTNKAFHRNVTTADRSMKSRTTQHTSGQHTVVQEDTDSAEGIDSASSENGAVGVLGDDDGGESEQYYDTSADTEPAVHEHAESVGPLLSSAEDTSIEMSSSSGLRTKKRRRGSATARSCKLDDDQLGNAANRLESMFVGTLSAAGNSAAKHEVQSKKALVCNITPPLHVSLFKKLHIYHISVIIKNYVCFMSRVLLFQKNRPGQRTRQK